MLLLNFPKGENKTQKEQTLNKNIVNWRSYNEITSVSVSVSVRNK